MQTATDRQDSPVSDIEEQTALHASEVCDVDRNKAITKDTLRGAFNILLGSTLDKSLRNMKGLENSLAQVAMTSAHHQYPLQWSRWILEP